MLTVKQRQLNLKTYYYLYKGNIDGIEGSKTKDAYKEFQRMVNITVDGIYGNNTNNKLIEVIKDIQSKLNNIDINLVKILDSIRIHYNNPIIITSGCRCKKNNSLVGGVSNSKHLYGKAADFVVLNVPTYEVLNYCNKLKKDNIIRYTYGKTINMGNAVHIDIN